MKTPITSFFAAILFLSVSAFANAATNPSRLTTADNSVNVYIEAITKGSMEHVNELFSKQFRQNTNANGKVISHSKEQVIGFLKEQQNVKQNCNTTYTVIEQSGDYSVAKVEMKYRDFTKVDYVTLGKEGADWKVNQVVTTYK